MCTYVHATHFVLPSGCTDDPSQFRVTLRQSDGLPPLTQCVFEVRAKVYETRGVWCTIIQYVGTTLAYLL